MVEFEDSPINFRPRIFSHQTELRPLTHQQSLELRGGILAQASRAKANTTAELANPGARISTRAKVRIVAHFQAHMAKLARTSILRLLG